MTTVSLALAEPATSAEPPQPLCDTAGAELFSVQWRHATVSTSSAAAAEGRWTIVAEPDDPVAQDLADRLSQGRPECQRISFDSLEQGLPAEYVVCIWPRNLHEDGDETPLRLLTTALSVAKRVLKQATRPLRLWWVTADSQAVTHHDPVCAVSSAALWGLGRAFTQEYPELSCTMVDVESRSDMARDLFDELCRADDETDVAWRGGRRHVARLTPADPSTEQRAPRSLRTDGTVLITGGLGDLGVGVALHLARQGIKHLLLTGRRGMTTPGAEQVVTQLKQLGSRVTVASVDVADRAAIARALAGIPDDLPLRGIIHCAGVLDRGRLADLNDQRASVVMRPKAIGGWHLHELSRDKDLDAFVMFSSVSGTVVAGGLGVYAAANAYLDALAAHRRHQGLSGQSLAWGLITNDAGHGAGVAVGFDDGQLRRAARDGLRSVTLEQAMTLLQRAMQRSEAALVPVPIDLEGARRGFAHRVPPLWRELLEPANDDSGGRRTWVDEFGTLKGEPLFESVSLAVSTVVAQVMLLDGPEDIEPDQPLTELGLDSLGAVDLCKALGDAIGQELDPELPFKHPTVEELAAHLIEQFMPAGDEL